MADKTHLKLLLKGVQKWNEWKLINIDVCPDLIGADLAGANLRGANLIGANLSRADLNGADLNWADLNGADLIEAALSGAALIGAHLYKAHLSRAHLFGADLRGAHLNEADLRWADLIGANLSGAHLNGADFSYVEIGETVFAAIDLSTVKGLDTAKYAAPSTIGFDTLANSKNLIPASFLRGCGLSDWQIEAAKLHQPDLTNEEINDTIYRIHDLRAQRPIQISPLFISYSHADGTFVDHLETYLVRDGVRFWRDVHHATAGRLERQVDRAMRLNPTVFLILSEHSVESDWVEHEARLARKLEKELGRDVLCPVALDRSWQACRWPERLREQIMEYNILDFSNWQDEAYLDRMYRKLLAGLDLFYARQDEAHT